MQLVALFASKEIPQKKKKPVVLICCPKALIDFRGGHFGFPTVTICFTSPFIQIMFFPIEKHSPHCILIASFWKRS